MGFRSCRSRARSFPAAPDCPRALRAIAAAAVRACGPGGWWIVAEPGIELPNDTKEISPDVAGWRRERMPELPIDEPLRVVPDWVCEILSKSTRRHDLLVKLPYYARVGVAYSWVVDLDARVLTAYCLESGAWRTIGTYSDETEARIEPFDVVPFNIADWWPPTAPDESR
jgi:Uma2 family endonuclease